jgi:cytochrome P450
LALGQPLNLTSGKADAADAEWIHTVTRSLQDFLELIMGNEGEMDIVMNDGDGETPNWDKMKLSWTEAFTHGEVIFDKAMKRLEDGDEKTINSYIGHRVAAMSDDKISKSDIVNNLVFFLLAAVDTTSNVMQFVLYNLAANPEVQETLRNQIFEVMGDKPLGQEHLKRMPYWHGVLKETYRLTPNANFTTRTLPQEIELGGYVFPPDTTFILTSTPYMWSSQVHTDPMKFDPTRWDRSKRDRNSLAHHPYMLMPASKGKRMCPAIRTAEVEVSAFVCRLLQSYRLKLAPDSPILPKSRSTDLQPPKSQYIMELL